MKGKKFLFSSAAASLTLGTLLISSVAFAQTTSSAPQQGSDGQQSGRGRGHMMQRMPGVLGTVSAISGSTLTVTSKMPMRQLGNTQSGSSASGTTYTVDASSATITKAGSTSSLSAIAVGDTVMVQGTISGTSVTAKEIHDGVPPQGEGRGPQDRTPLIQGNGQPIVGGTVSTVNGNTLTVTTAQGNNTYTVDASSATVLKYNATSSVSAISVGDKVVVQGTVNGSSVTASSVIDQGAQQSGSSSSGTLEQGRPHGFFGVVQGFFHRLFGFF